MNRPRSTLRRGFARALALVVLALVGFSNRPLEGAQGGAWWSTPGKELGFWLPGRWNAVYDQNLGFVVRLQPPSGGQAALTGSLTCLRLGPAERGVPLQTLAPRGLTMVRQRFPHLAPGQILYGKTRTGLAIAHVGLTGRHLQTGQPWRVWVGSVIADAYLISAVFQGVASPAFDHALSQMQNLVSTVRFREPARNTALEAQLVGTWQKVVRYRYRPGNTSHDSQAFMTYAPGNRYVYRSTGSWYAKAKGPIRRGGTTYTGTVGTAAGQNGITDTGAYEVRGRFVILRSQQTGQERTLPLVWQSGALVVAGERWVKIR